MRKLDRSSVPAPKALARLKAQAKHDWNQTTPEDKQAIREALSELQRPGPESAPTCAYCEQRITALHNAKSCHIEHFRRRRDFPSLSFDWDNLFLSCSRESCCGTYKDRKGVPYNPDDLLKPDRDTPTDYLIYLPNGTVQPKSGLPAQDQNRAKETVRVFHLNEVGLKGWRRSLLEPLVKDFEQLHAPLCELYPDGGPDFERELAAELEHFLQSFDGEPLQAARRQVLLGR